MKNRLVQKALSLAITIALLMVALMMISDVVRDRIYNRDRAMQSVVNSTAGAQTLFGPVLAQRCSREVSGKDSEGRVETRLVSFQRYALPDEITHQARTDMQPRARGLYQVNTFLLADKLVARFAPGNQLQGKPEGASVRHCDAPRLILPLSDPRGIRSAALLVDGKPLPLEPGTGHAVYSRGLQSKPLPTAMADSSAAMEVVVQLQLMGTERLAFVPLGGTNQVSMQADWPHPSFGGNFLPLSREVSDQGFGASWSIPALASSARQAFVQERPLCSLGIADTSDPYASNESQCLEQFGTSFIDPVNPYSLSDRATKYGVLFVVLTFVAVAMFEVLKKLRVHPVQYLLVGSALCIFFLLLISLSEHVGFSQAYAIGASACVLLLGYYASHILGSLRRGLPFAALIAVMYGLLFVLLQLEQTALAVGSLALFAVLAIVMVATRKVDWYAFGKSDSTEPAKAAKAAAYSPQEAA
ncbi:cell envelope integrity protein CreD [Comamonas piscis]|uniref:Cell envelope integrity protein CreD n=1 Tax=Comamonas piscis TaxID=1562974 RepID=A0A7G5EBW5_9BURK|nr:cell envelope integrity protein CreD [Comamonas piscis]QMV71490.1 cell envelope integrity protein CreD [Comamonas piscis]WSO34202.1 cell envelope integrity protein CreD [Comamonas piscis]